MLFDHAWVKFEFYSEIVKPNKPNHKILNTNEKFLPIMFIFNLQSKAVSDFWETDAGIELMYGAPFGIILFIFVTVFLSFI